jgi:HlyD family secretion protein
MKYFKGFLSFVFIILLSSCNNKKEENSFTASGTIESVNVTVSAKSSGQIRKLNFIEGANVKTGDLLVEIDHDLQDIQLRQAESGVDLAEAQLKLLLSGARREDIKQSEELVKQAKINLDLAKTDFDRTSSLLKDNAITQKQYDDAKGRYDLTVTQYNSTKENLSKVKSIIRPEEIEQARANLKHAVASVDLLKKYIEDCKIYAPVSGVVSKKFMEIGETVAPGASLLKISDLEIVNLVIYVPETDLAKIKLGQKADITIDAYKDKTYQGKIIFISPEAEFTPKNIQTNEERTKLVFAVKIEIANPQSELKPGLPADAKISF